MKFPFAPKKKKIMNILLSSKKKKKIESIGIQKEREKKKWGKIAKKTSKI